MAPTFRLTPTRGATQEFGGRSLDSGAAPDIPTSTTPPYGKGGPRPYDNPWRPGSGGLGGPGDAGGLGGPGDEGRDGTKGGDRRYPMMQAGSNVSQGLETDTSTRRLPFQTVQQFTSAADLAKLQQEQPWYDWRVIGPHGGAPDPNYNGPGYIDIQGFLQPGVPDVPAFNPLAATPFMFTGVQPTMGYDFGTGQYTNISPGQRQVSYTPPNQAVQPSSNLSASQPRLGNSPNPSSGVGIPPGEQGSPFGQFMRTPSMFAGRELDALQRNFFNRHNQYHSSSSLPAMFRGQGRIF